MQKLNKKTEYVQNKLENKWLATKHVNTHGAHLHISILRRDTNQGTPPPSVLTADGFLKFFSDKVESVRGATMGHPLPRILPTAVTSLSHFRACTEDEVREVIMRSPSKSCSLDPIPTTILKECIDDLQCAMHLCSKDICQHAIITPWSRNHISMRRMWRTTGRSPTSPLSPRWLSDWYRSGLSVTCKRTIWCQLNSQRIGETFNWDSVAPGHLGPSQLHGQTRGNAARTSRSQCRVRLCRSWHPAITTGADVWHRGFGNRMDTILPHGPDAASGIPWSAVWHPEVGFRRPTRFRA